MPGVGVVAELAAEEAAGGEDDNAQAGAIEGAASFDGVEVADGVVVGSG